MTITDTSVRSNTSNGTSTSAGGIYNNATLTLNGVVVSGNTQTYIPSSKTVPSVAGGVANYSNGNLTLINTIIKENKGYTGGLYEGGGSYSYLNMVSGAIYNNLNHSEEVSDLFTYYNANQTYLPANKMTDKGTDFSCYTWSLNGNKADTPNKSSDVNGSWNVILDDNAPVAEIIHGDGTTTAYSDFAVAVDAAAEGETIRLLRDKVISKGNTLKDKSIIVDLNGKELNLDPDAKYYTALFAIKGDKTLTIKGSGAIGQYLSVGEQAGSSEKYTGHLIIEASGNIAFASLDDDYKPIVCTTGDVIVKGNDKIEKLTADVSYTGSFTAEKNANIGTLNITGKSTKKEIILNGDVGILNLTLLGNVKATLNGTVGELTLKFLKSLYERKAYLPEVTAGDDFQLTGKLIFYPADVSIYNSATAAANNEAKPVDFACPIEKSPDIVAIRGNLKNKVDLDNLEWVNALGGPENRELVWKTVMKCRKSIVESHENISLTAHGFSAIR